MTNNKPRKTHTPNMSAEDKQERLEKIRKQYGAAPMAITNPFLARGYPDGLVLDTTQIVRDIVSHVKQTDPERKCYGKRLLAARKARGFTQERAAKTAGITHTAISNLENTDDVDFYAVELFSLIYDVSPCYLMRLTDDMAKYIWETKLEVKEEKFPISFVQDDRAKMKPFIINRLSELGSCGKKCMEIMIQAANASDHKIIKMESRWINDDFLREIWDADFDEYLESQNAKERYYSEERPLDCHDRYFFSEGRSCIQVVTYTALSKLSIRAEDVLEFFTKVTASSDSIRERFILTTTQD